MKCPVREAKVPLRQVAFAFAATYCNGPVVFVMDAWRAEAKHDAPGALRRRTAVKRVGHLVRSI